MKKILLFALFTFITTTASAQLNLDMSSIISKLKMSEAFIAHLETCTPYKEGDTTDVAGQKYSYMYRVIGQEDGLCIFETSGDAESGSNKSVCRFDEQTLTQYVTAMKEVLKVTEFTTDNMQTMMQDKNFVAVADIFNNEKYCQTSYSAIDNYKKVRQHLENCSSYTETQSLDNASITYNIKGRSGGLCNFEQKINIVFSKMLAASFGGEDMGEQSIVFTCALNPAQRRELISLFKGMIIPAGNSMAALSEAINDLAPMQQKLTEFFQQNCIISD
ncbi:MAG: hypothetical protein J6Y91_00440 [Alphaproteobacteria bacterium]|nr:hypothetical protein [Alphaproteobacteria bacterium]